MKASVCDRLNDSFQKLNQFLSRLQKLAEEFNIAILLTNQVQADPGVSDPWSSAKSLTPDRPPRCLPPPQVPSLWEATFSLMRESYL